MELIQTVRKALALLAEGGSQTPWFQPDGSQVVYGSPGWVLAMQNAGYAYIANAGAQSTPITFAGAFDATAPDAYFYVPNGVTILPYEIEVIYEAVGTESTMEPIALASPIGDSTAAVTGGALVTPRNQKIGSPLTSGLTVSGGVDASGITTPVGAGAYDFWKNQRPLTDTVATGENDRHELVFRWNGITSGMPIIQGQVSTGSCLAIYAASQAGTGFITVKWLEFATTEAVKMFGAVGS